MRRSNSPDVVNTYASSGSASRWARVVHERLSHSAGSRFTSASTIVPLPTPPGPETTTINGSRAELAQQRRPLLSTKALHAAVVGDADLVHHAPSLHLAHTGQ